MSFLILLPNCTTSKNVSVLSALELLCLCRENERKSERERERMGVNSLPHCQGHIKGRLRERKREKREERSSEAEERKRRMEGEAEKRTNWLQICLKTPSQLHKPQTYGPYLQRLKHAPVD
ncbi:hypothetical protein WMY93_027185 [Mugilogobius chulae]|uniref:Uncharacterized protein n=1 Tax=Mugilogobius chulae TaxID=88201 RepID=A0AAW0MWL3_9GOBI